MGRTTWLLLCFLILLPSVSAAGNITNSSIGPNSEIYVNGSLVADEISINATRIQLEYVRETFRIVNNGTTNIDFVITSVEDQYNAFWREGLGILLWENIDAINGFTLAVGESYNYTVNTNPSDGSGGGETITSNIQEINETEEIIIEDVPESFCGDDICVMGENMMTCWGDCKLTYDTTISCWWDEERECNLKQNLVPISMLGFLILLGFAMQETEEFK